MHIEFLIEEASAEIVLTEIVPKILGDEVTFKIHDFRGKVNLLNKLPQRMKGLQFTEISGRLANSCFN